MKSKLLIVLGLPLYLNAQDSIGLKEVIVTGNRIETSVMESGKNVTVITREQIARMPVRTVNELLQHVAGVDLRQRGAWGAQADVSTRGGSFDQCLVLVNGIKMNDPQTGHHNMNLGIDIQSIRQIEVIKGPAASRYGLNAFTGVINIITEPAGESRLNIGSYIAQGGNAKLPAPYHGGYEVHGSAHWAGSKTRHMVSGSRTQSTGYRPNTDLSRHAATYQSVTDTRAGEFNLLGSFVSNDFGASGFYAYPIDSTSEEQVETWLAAIQHTLRKNAWQFKTKAYTRKNFDTYTLFREAPAIYQNRHRTDVGGAELHAAYTYAIGTAGIGVEFRQEAITSNNLGQRTRDNLGIFGENRLSLLRDKLNLSAGFYLNRSNAFGTRFLPSVDVNYQLTQSLHAFATWGQSFRVPTFTDLYYVGPTNVGNPGLKPEQATNYEAGMKWGHGRHYVQASAFYQQATDLIDWTRDSVTQPWQPMNYESVGTTGFEFNYDLRATQKLSEVITWDVARASYTWLDMQIASTGETISRYTLNNLRHQVTLQSALTFWNKVGVTLTGRYLDRMAYKSYWLADARVQYTTPAATLWLDCTNLLDTAYVEAAQAPMPGRWFRLGFELQVK